MQLHTERQGREEYPIRYGQESPGRWKRGADGSENMVPEPRGRDVVRDGGARHRAGVCWHSVRRPL